MVFPTRQIRNSRELPEKASADSDCDFAIWLIPNDFEFTLNRLPERARRSAGR
jgi:hypothetical protein